MTPFNYPQFIHFFSPSKSDDSPLNPKTPPKNNHGVDSYGVNITLDRNETAGGADLRVPVLWDLCLHHLRRLASGIQPQGQGAGTDRSIDRCSRRGRGLGSSATILGCFLVALGFSKVGSPRMVESSFAIEWQRRAILISFLFSFGK